MSYLSLMKITLSKEIFMQKKPYKNAVKTKLLIKQTFLDLLSTNPLNSVRVKDILEKCDISKGTFYAHFKDVSDILHYIENEHLTWITKMLLQYPPRHLIENFSPFLKSFFSAVKNQISFNKIVFENPCFIDFLLQFQQLIIRYMMCDKSVTGRVEDSERLKLFFSFTAMGIIDLLKNWIESDYKYTVDTMADYLSKCLNLSVNCLFDN